MRVRNRTAAQCGPGLGEDFPCRAQWPATGKHENLIKVVTRTFSTSGPLWAWPALGRDTCTHTHSLHAHAHINSKNSTLQRKGEKRFISRVCSSFSCSCRPSCVEPSSLGADTPPNSIVVQCRTHTVTAPHPRQSLSLNTRRYSTVSRCH